VIRTFLPSSNLKQWMRVKIFRAGGLGLRVRIREVLHIIYIHIYIYIYIYICKAHTRKIDKTNNYVDKGEDVCAGWVPGHLCEDSGGTIIHTRKQHT